jgi:thymidylate synthase
MNCVEDIRDYFRSALDNEEFVIDKTGVKTIEMIGASFIANEDHIFGTPNQDYITREIEWYISKSLNVNDIRGNTPKIWQEVSDKDGFINSNYGYLIFSQENYNQFDRVVDELRSSPNSRRATMIYTRPSIWEEYNKNGMSDFICTNTVQYFIRDDKLISHVSMRSNDVVFGYNNDFAWQRYVSHLLCNYLNVELGKIIWNVGSLHVYERHFDLIK